MCPYYLDGDRTLRFRGGSVIPVAVPAYRKGTAMWLLCSFQGPQGGAPRDSRAGLSKLNSMLRLKLCGMQKLARPGSVDILGRTVGSQHIELETQLTRRTTEGLEPALAPCCTGPMTGLPRKEVIQPHLPVRLPCYDFTPVTSPTFDGSLPCGLGHRLRVLLTPVV
jgi:hypothetical protein